MVNHRTLTAAMIDSRDFLAAKRRAETELLLPAGPEDRLHRRHRLQRSPARSGTALDKVRAKHPDMVLLHGGSPKGAERIAACWADNRKVPQIAFKPDWTRHGKAAPFKRNDQMLDVLPIGVIVFPGSGITDNLADKAKKLGIPVWTFTAARERRHYHALQRDHRSHRDYPSNTAFCSCSLPRDVRRAFVLAVSCRTTSRRPIRVWIPKPMQRSANLMRRAVVVVGGAAVDFARRSTTMIIIGIILSFVGLAYLCWLLFALAVHALPFFAGVTAGLAAYHSGSGPIAAIIVGAIAGGITLLARTDRVHDAALTPHARSDRARSLHCRLPSPGIMPRSASRTSLYPPRGLATTQSQLRARSSWRRRPGRAWRSLPRPMPSQALPPV